MPDTEPVIESSGAAYRSVARVHTDTESKATIVASGPIIAMEISIAKFAAGSATIEVSSNLATIRRSVRKSFAAMLRGHPRYGSQR